MAEKRGRGRPATLTHEQRKEQLRAGTAAQPPEQEVPDGMATLVLYVPMEQIIGKSPPDIQDDLGLPWSVVGGEDPVWFDELV